MRSAAPLAKRASTSRPRQILLLLVSLLVVDPIKPDVIFTATNAGNSSEVARPSLVSDERTSIDGVVTKTRVSSKLRLMFYVGLEGSGHNYMDGVFEDMYSKHRKRLLRIDNPVAMSTFYLADSMTRGVSGYANLCDLATRSMASLAKRAEGLAPPGTVAKTLGRISYPNLIGPKKALQYVDVRMMAEEAETAGVDFRIVYLRRSARDLVIANTVHRNFQFFLGDEGDTSPEQRFMDYMRILLTDAGVMHSLLAEIDPAFVVCHEFDFIGGVEQAAEIAEFVSPGQEVAEMLKASLIGTARQQSATIQALPFEGAEKIVARVQRKLDTFESTFCAR